MTDRELLAYAAKAAGYEYAKYGGYIVVDGIPGNWNPLTDDGDALRLAVKLKITIGPDSDEKNARAEAAWGYPMVMEDYLDDPYAATRRAIVRTAAEIWRARE